MSGGEGIQTHDGLAIDRDGVQGVDGIACVIGDDVVDVVDEVKIVSYVNPITPT